MYGQGSEVWNLVQLCFR